MLVRSVEGMLVRSSSAQLNTQGEQIPASFLAWSFDMAYYVWELVMLHDYYRFSQGMAANDKHMQPLEFGARDSRL